MNAAPSILPLRIEGLGYAVGAERLLDLVNLTVEAGRRLVILGPNGAGKSLLLRLCHGLIRPTEGRIDWALPEGAAKGQAMVFHGPVLLRRSARANIDHALALAHCPRSDRVPRAEAALRRFGLSALGGRPARLLSGGEQQRLALARAWALRPEVLFLDEPCAQLDPGATLSIEHMIEEIGGDGITVVMTTHDLGQARRLAEDVAFLHRGRLLEHGSASAFFGSPKSPEARAFLAGALPW